MEKNHNYLEDISEIRRVMDRSSRFLSLAGWSGILAGVYALAGVAVGVQIYNNNGLPGPKTFTEIFALAAGVFFLAAGTAVLLAYRKSKKNGIPFWTAVTKRLLVSMFVPLFTGGVFLVVLYRNDLIGLMLPATLIFYGLALVNASNFTIGELWSLVVIQLALGLLACFFTRHAVWIWAIGFGALHIIYGALMWYRYERSR